MNTIEKFYQAFQGLDYITMQFCYHPAATFYDPVFEELNADEVKAMWQMLCQRAENFSLEYKNVVCSDNEGSCEWIATYTFSKTKRKVINHVHSRFVLKDGRIIQQKDKFSLWNWSRQAFGLLGMLLGWLPFLKNKIRSQARVQLIRFIKTHGNNSSFSNL